MNKTMYKYTVGLFAAGMLMGASACTDKFEEYNTNPFAPTPEQMQGDNMETKTLLSNQFPLLIPTQENDYQMIEQMIGEEFGHTGACHKEWGSHAFFYTYNPDQGWCGYPFNKMFPQIYSNFFQIKEKTGGTGLVYNLGLVLRVYGSHRVSDIYGPIPYSKVNGADYTVPYDDMETLYDAMFADLDEAIANLNSLYTNGGNASTIADVDDVFGGDLKKWIQFANTLKLRMAIRISGVKPALAQQKAEEAVADATGVITEASGMVKRPTIDNSLYKTHYIWGESRISATLTSYMDGFQDPRLAVYCTEGAYGRKGIRNGMYPNANTTRYLTFSDIVCTQSSDLIVMSAAEAWFLRAEGALRGWNMGGDAQTLYEEGVKVSFKERGVDIGTYLASTNTPADYEDNASSANNISAVSQTTPAWDESATAEQKLERILVQKWLANFPNGWERWCDFRRTGYPKAFPVVNNLNTDGVTSERGMRRVPYSQTEYTTNTANVQAAVGMLGGPDTGATDLWWAKKD